MVDSSSLLGAVEIEVRANLDKLGKDFDRGRTEAQRFQKDMVTFNKVARDAGDLSVATAENAKRLAAQQQAFAASMNAVTRASNPAIVSQRLLGQAVKSAEKDFIAGAISANQYARVQKLAARAAAEAGIAMGAAGVGSDHMGRSMLASVRNARFLISAIGIGLVTAITTMIKKSADATAAIADIARQVGLTNQQLQEYRGIAKQVGMSADDMDGAFKEFTQTVKNAAAGNEQAQKLFGLLGIKIRDAKGQIKPTNELFLQTIDRLGEVGNKAERAAGQAAAFGEAYGPKMGQLVDQGSKGIDSLREAVDATGIVMSDDLINRSAEVKKKLEQVQEVLGTKVAGTVTENAQAIGVLADALTTLASAAIQALAEVVKFFGYMADHPASAILLGLNPAAAIGNFVGGRIAGEQGGDSSSVTVKLPEATPVAKTGTRSLASLLAPKPSKGRQPRAPVENQFERESLREQEENLKLLRDRSGNLVEINSIDKQLIDINLKERIEQLNQMVHRKSLTAGQAKKLRAEAEDNAGLEREAADRKMREGLIEQRFRNAEESLQLEQDGLQIQERLARTDEDRRKIELAILDAKQEQARAEIEKQIALATEANDEGRIAELTEERKKLLENQHQDVKAFAVEHLTGMEKFKNDLPATVAEINEQIGKIRFDLFTQRLERAANLARSIGDAFGRAAGAIARFENPLDAVKGLLSDLAQTLTENVIEKPISDWATRNIGLPFAKQAMGKGLTGPDQLTVQQMNVALGLATQNLTLLQQAALNASMALGSGVGAGGAGAAAAADALAHEATGATQALSAQTPAINQFGTGLLSVLSMITSGGGGGGSGASGFLSILGSIASGAFGGGGAAAGADVTAGALAIGDFGLGGGFSGGGFTGSGADGDVAGLVHRNEFVFDAPTTRSLKPLLQMISTGRTPDFSGPGMGGMMNGKGARHTTLRLGDVHLHGVKDDRSARKSARQFMGHVQRGLAEVSRRGLNK